MTDSSRARERKPAYQVVADSRPRRTHRGAVVGCGRMGSTIDDEHVGLPHYPWPWAHAPAMIEAAGVDLIAGVDVDRAKLDDFGRRWGVRALYTDVQEMVAKERPDIVSVTTRPEERPEVVAALAEAGGGNWATAAGAWTRVSGFSILTLLIWGGILLFAHIGRA